MEAHGHEPGPDNAAADPENATFREIDPAQWRKTVIEVLVEAREPVSLLEIKERAGTKLNAPAPPALEEQMQSLLRLGHIERIPKEGLYRATERGHWLAEGESVLHGST